MAKLVRGRLIGSFHSMEGLSIAELHYWIERLERSVRYPFGGGDPAWYLQCARKLRLLVTQKEKARRHKESCRRKRPRAAEPLE
jgi:hypothetical protein